MIRSPRILLFDSGMGGLTVASAIREALPLAQLVYAADSAGFPYGAWEEVRLIERILAVVGKLIDASGPDLVVIACNTASTLALMQLREIYSVPFVGTVPAIKPAAQQTKSGIIGVLATPGTAKREYTQALIQTYAYHCKVFLHGAQKLAEMAEGKLLGTPVDADDLRDEIQPVFRHRGNARIWWCSAAPITLCCWMTYERLPRGPSIISTRHRQSPDGWWMCLSSTFWGTRNRGPDREPQSSHRPRKSRQGRKPMTQWDFRYIKSWSVRFDSPADCL
jgi:glutamate racemase